MNRRLGRYILFDELASGGMGRVHVGKLRSEGGFSRVVAIKVLHEQYAREAEFRSMFLDEARLVASIRHPNVVSTLDVVEDGGELFLVMEYVNGLPLSQLIRDVRSKESHLPVRIAAAIVIDALEGLHAAHEGRGERSEALDIVHRDVSPQNIMVADDGLARVVDFGVAHATGRLQKTVPGQIKGKAGYIAPEQATDQGVDRRADVYGAGVVLWEALAGARLFRGSSFGAVVLQHLLEKPPAPSSERAEIPAALDAVVLKALEKKPADRYPTAHDMAAAIEAAVGRATRSEVRAWLEETAPEPLASRRALLARLPREPLDETSVSPPPEPAGVAPDSQSPTRADVPDAKRVSALTPLTATDDRPSESASLVALDDRSWRPPGRRLVPAVVVALLLGVVALVAVRRETPIAASTRPTPSTSPSPTAPASPALPAEVQSPPLAAVSAQLSGGGLPPAERPKASPLPNPRTRARVVAAEPPASASVGPSAPQELPRCCVRDRAGVILFRRPTPCQDNCAP